jgi:hypothetical protein
LVHANRERSVVTLSSLVNRVVSHVDIELVLHCPKLARERAARLSYHVFLTQNKGIFRKSEFECLCFLCFPRHACQLARRYVVYLLVSLILAADRKLSNQLVLE